jgi:hypothetical protein
MSVVEELKEIFADLKNLKNAIKKEEGERISKQSLKSRAEGIAMHFFTTIYYRLEANEFIIHQELTKYNDAFTRLLKLPSSNNRKTSYLETLDLLIERYKDDLVIPLSTHPEAIVSKGFDSLFGDLGVFPEREYLEEAIGCAESGFRRGAVVLGWSAVVYRFQSKIEKCGFQNFNSASSTIASKTQGRFKRYNKIFNIQDSNDLNEVFDTDILWVLEGMDLIDMNEHTRLRSCFDLRCQGAHPCSAPITDYNLLSFFSDIKEIIFKNPRFLL